jgi:periplasmic protein TonB
MRKNTGYPAAMLEVLEHAMTNAEPTSTDSTTERAETTESQPSLVAVSEENLAALLRATNANAEPEAQNPPEAAASEVATPVADATEVSEVAEPVPSAPVEAVESRLALFAAVKEHQSEILRAAVTPEPAAQTEYPSASLPAEAAPIQVTLPKSQPVIAVSSASTAAPSRTRLVIGCVIGAVIVVAGLFLLWPKSHAPKTPTVAALAPKDNAPLQLLAEPLGNGLINVRWNAQSSLITQARDGRLVIIERDKAPRTMALDVAQLKIGHLTYQSPAESIQFDLEVNDISGAVAKESILSLSSPGGTAPPTARDPVAAVKPQAVAEAATPKVQTAAPPSVQATAEVSQPSPAKARAFVPPPTQQKREQAAIIDAPPALANAPVTPLGVALPARLTPLSPPPASAPQQIRVETNLQAANLIKKIVPIYPGLAKSAGIEGIVKFTAVIGTDGKIQNLKVISGPTPLVEAASDAVKRWVYRPTLLNGQPVEVITQISVNFTISGASR